MLIEGFISSENINTRLAAVFQSKLLKLFYVIYTSVIILVHIVFLYNNRSYSYDIVYMALLLNALAFVYQCAIACFNSHGALAIPFITCLIINTDDVVAKIELNLLIMKSMYNMLLFTILYRADNFYTQDTLESSGFSLFCLSFLHIMAECIIFASVVGISKMGRLAFTQTTYKSQRQKFVSQEHRIKECSICCEDFVDGDSIKVLKCNHLFHSHCIDEWTKIQNRCPLCRKDSFENGSSIRRIISADIID